MIRNLSTFHLILPFNTDNFSGAGVMPMIDSHSMFLLISALVSVIGLIVLIAVVKLNPGHYSLSHRPGARHRRRHAASYRDSFL